MCNLLPPTTHLLISSLHPQSNTMVYMSEDVIFYTCLISHPRARHGQNAMLHTIDFERAVKKERKEVTRVNKSESEGALEIKRPATLEANDKKPFIARETEE